MEERTDGLGGGEEAVRLGESGLWVVCLVLKSLCCHVGWLVGWCQWGNEARTIGCPEMTMPRGRRR
jgi:hypothetical protein